MQDYANAIVHVRGVLAKIEQVISEKEEWFPFSNESSDGRRNSQTDEPLVTQYLLDHPTLNGLLVKKATKTVKKGKKKDDDEDNRAFGDIGIDLSAFGYSESFPCNIKIISVGNKADNNTCGLIHLIAYTFKKDCHNHDAVMKIIVELDKNGYDNITPKLYGIIQIQKETNRCWVGTFDEVPDKSIGTNPSNPLQVPFLDDRVTRTHKEYINLLIDKIVEYHKKKSQPYAIWAEYQATKSL
jgi:hypothetical protein